MIPLTPDLWRRIEPLLDQALELDATARVAFLDRACADEPQVRSVVEALLRADEQAEGFLEAAGTIAPARLHDARAASVAAEPRSREGQRIGAFRIVRELAVGGMGVVYLAERADGQFEQRVALKVIGRSVPGEEMRRRFLRERQILARLQHASIAFLLDGGITADGMPWFAMEYVEGEPITRYCDEYDLGLDERLQLFGRVCAAVEYAHSHQVVHRDLKPANILVTGTGELKLIDFGIAHAFDDHTDAVTIITAPGLQSLTPEYAAPEQIRCGSVTPATDIYALGVVLYELLCGRRPHRVTSHDAAELERLICEEAPAPSSITRNVSQELDHIVLRALHREPEARYPTAAALAEDVGRYLEGGAIRADRRTPHRPPPPLRRNRRIIAGAVIGALLVGTASAFIVRRAVVPEPLGAAPEGGTSSAVARSMYDEGLRAYRQVDLHAARRFFRAAVEEDSLFAAAAYYAIRTEWWLGMPPDSQLQTRLRRVAARLPERERLLVQARIAWTTADPAMLGIGDTLLAHYPDEPQAHLVMGRAFVGVGEPYRGLDRLQRALQMDSSGLRTAPPECTACDALATIISVYLGLDSLGAAERTAREWIRHQPASGRAWHELATIMEWQGRTEEALVAVRRAAPLAPANPYVPIFPALLDIRSGEFESADRLLREQARAGPPDVQQEALWFLTISLRHQGRLRDALATARLLRRLHPEKSEPRIAEAQVLLEMGHAQAAVARFDSLSTFSRHGDFERAPSMHAKVRSWSLVHLATARAAAGDTAALLPLADTIQSLGTRTLGALYRSVHHHVRGLLLAARGAHAEAAELFRHAALHPVAPTSGYTRTNLELARAQLALDRPEEAIRTLQPALRRGLEAGGLYVTRTDLQEMLGYAFEASGQADSARVVYTQVLAAWQNADPEFDARRDSLRLRLRELDR
jgi:serine/threonine protein kinase/tetratricopeptide (TPR) repeat protein